MANVRKHNIVEIRQSIADQRITYHISNKGHVYRVFLKRLAAARPFYALPCGVGVTLHSTAANGETLSLATLNTPRTTASGYKTVQDYLTATTVPVPPTI